MDADSETLILSVERAPPKSPEPPAIRPAAAPALVAELEALPCCWAEKRDAATLSRARARLEVATVLE